MSLPAIAQLEFDDNTPVISATVHKSYEWDFEKGDFKLQDGKLNELSGIEYLKIWIQKALRTVFNSSFYQGTDYGSEHHSLVGKNFNMAYMQSEYERLIGEALKQNDAIKNVDNFSFSQIGSRLIIAFDVQSIYGAISEAVKV